VSGAIAGAQVESTEACWHWDGLDGLPRLLRAYLQRHCRDANDVEDVVQETLMRAARARGRLREDQCLEGWSLRIARNVWKDRLRARARLRQVQESELVLGALEAPTDVEESLVLQGQVWERELVQRLIQESLQGLPAADRELLSAWSRRSSGRGELARQQGITPTLLKVRLYRARRRLHVALRGRLALSSSTPLSQAPLSQAPLSRDPRPQAGAAPGALRSLSPASALAAGVCDRECSAC